MKKIVMSVIMCVALMGSTSLMAQDSTPKCCKEKKECTKSTDKDKKECSKDKTEKSCCTKK